MIIKARVDPQVQAVVFVIPAKATVFDIPAQAGIQTHNKQSSISFEPVDPSLRWGDWWQ